MNDNGELYEGERGRGAKERRIMARGIRYVIWKRRKGAMGRGRRYECGIKFDKEAFSNRIVLYRDTLRYRDIGYEVIH